MPEAAEVRKMVDWLELARDSVIIGAKIVSGRYTKKPIVGFNHLVGMKVEKVGCKGKLIYMILEQPEGSLAPPLVVLSTLGMAGHWNFNAKPKHLRLTLAVQKMGESGPNLLYFSDPRNFGTFKLVSKKAAQAKLNELGPEVMHENTPPPIFWERLERFGRKKTVAEVLLDQRVFCGVGNYIRADAAWHAQIDPRRPVSSLEEREWTSLWMSCWHIANCARQDIDPVNHHSTRPGGGFQHGCYGQDVTPFGDKVERYTDANGRTVHWAPAYQK
jgi:formamidopyrimidine-DNA glycosylase